MNTGRVREGFLTKPDIAMDFPAINNKYVAERTNMHMPKLLIQ